MLNAWGFRINKSFGALSSLQVLRIGHIIRITCFFFKLLTTPGFWHKCFCLSLPPVFDECHECVGMAYVIGVRQHNNNEG